MVHAEPGEGGAGGRQGTFLVRLYSQAGRRWLMLGAALVVLLALGIFAGHLRNPDAVKRGWAVTVSRVLAGVGAVILARLVLVSYDERIPVLFFDLRSGGRPPGMPGRIGDAVRGLERRGHEVVPLGDILEFVRDQRYVPRKCIGLVIEAAGPEDLPEIGDALSGSPVTVLLGAENLGGRAPAWRDSNLPAGISLGVSLVGGRAPHDAADLKRMLEDSKAGVAGLTGTEPAYARVDAQTGIDLRGLLKETAYTCFLDGRGFNRFGDEPHVLRLLDVTAVVARGGGSKALATCIGLFKGKYYLWPAAAAMRLTDLWAEGT